MAERNNVYSLRVELDGDAGIVTVVVREKDGSNFKEIESGTFNVSDLPEEIRKMTDLYGLSKVLQDRCSDTKAGPGKLDAMREVFDQLVAGDWERERKAGAPTVSAEVEALAQIKGVSVGDIQKALRKFTKEQKEKIFAKPEIAELAATIRAGREASEVSLDDML